MKIQRNEIIEQIKYCKEEGWKVIPLAHNSKCPPKQTDNYQTWGKLRELPINENIKECARYFKYNEISMPNIGIITGKENNLVVLDFDNAKGRYFFEKFIEDEIISTPTPSVITPRGIHLYYSYNNWESLHIQTYINLVEGVNVYSTGAYVVAVPSIVQEHKYHWLDGTMGLSPTPLPDSFITLMKTRYIEEEVTILPVNVKRSVNIKEHHGHELHKIGSALRRDGFNIYEIRALLSQSNATRCKSALSEEKLSKIIDFIFKDETK